MRNRDHRKKVGPGTWIAIAVVLIAAAPEFFVSILVIAIFIAIIASPFVILYFAKKKKGPSPKSAFAKEKPMESRRQIPMDDCPKPICFHKDKGEHHVRRGKEIDPWDRPDIDISKYQRRE